MPSRARRLSGPKSSGRRVLVLVLVALFLVVDVVVIALAVARIADAEATAGGPIPSFGIPDVPTPEPEESAPPAALAAQNRYIATVDGVTMWRSTLGSCEGDDAVIEFSTNGGAAWSTLVTTEMRARQVLALEVVDADTIWVVARAGDTCAVSGFASFTGGEFWEPRPEAVTLLRYLDRDAADVVHLQGQPVAAPCAEPRQSVSRDGATTVVCDDMVAEWSGSTGTWATLVVPGLLSAAPTAGNHTLAVWGAAGCDGVSIQVVPSPLGLEQPVRTGCIQAETAPTDVSLLRSGNTVWAWVDGDFRVSADGGASW